MNKRWKGLCSLWLVLALLVSLAAPALAAPNIGATVYTYGRALTAGNTVYSDEHSELSAFQAGTPLPNADMDMKTIFGEKYDPWMDVALDGWKLWTGYRDSGRVKNIAAFDGGAVRGKDDVVVTQEEYDTINDDYLLLEPQWLPHADVKVGLDPDNHNHYYWSTVILDTPLDQQEWLQEKLPENTLLTGWNLWNVGSGNTIDKGPLALNDVLTENDTDPPDVALLIPSLLVRYAFSHQPTAAEPYVEVWNNIDGAEVQDAAYQWYTYAEKEYTVADADGENAIGVDEYDPTYFGVYADGKWSSVDHNLGLLLTLQAGDVVTATLDDPSLTPDCNLYDYDYDSSDAIPLEGNNGVYSFVVPADVIYLLAFEGPELDTEFDLTCTVTRTGLEAVSGQTDSAFTGEAGTYTCKATMDGVTLTSDPVDIPHQHDGVTFTAWDKTDSLPTDPGNYYLTGDVTLSASWNVPTGDAVHLCLNGHKVQGDFGGITEKKSVIQMFSNRTLSLYDCDKTTTHTITSPVTGEEVTIQGGLVTGGTNYGIMVGSNFSLYGGTIAGNTAASFGGGVYVNGASAEFHMYGGAITHNALTSDNGGYGGGVYVGADGTFHMSGGSITNNVATYGGGVCYSKGTFTLSGDAVITGNQNERGADNNIYLPDGKRITIGEGGLTRGASIGVTTATAPTEMTSVPVTGPNDADYSEYFTSDNSDYAIENSGSDFVHLTLKPAAPAHSHDMSVDCGGEAPVTFEAWTATDSLPTTPGHYYLTGNVTLSSRWYGVQTGDDRTIDLCLNGKTVTFAGQTAYAYVRPQSRLNLCDCQEGGKITSAARQDTPLQVGGGAATLYGGTIERAATYSSSAFYYHAVDVLSGGFHLAGGALRANGIPLYVRFTGTAYLSGAPTLTVTSGDFPNIRIEGNSESFSALYAHGENGGAAYAGDTLAIIDDSEGVGDGTVIVHGVTDGNQDKFTLQNVGFFMAREGDGLIAHPYAITTQPTAQSPTVVTNHPDGASYQWCTADVTAVKDTTTGATPGSSASCDEDTGAWTTSAGDSDQIAKYFSLPMKAGDSLLLTPMNNSFDPDSGQFMLLGEGYENQAWSSTIEADGKVWLTAPADDTYTFIFYGSGAVPTVQTEHLKLTPVSGQTTASLTTTAAGTYACQITWPNGTVLVSDLVTLTAPSHTHAPTKVTGQGATCTQAGWKDYYSCTCGKYFSDAAGNTEITDLSAWKAGSGKVDMTAHDFSGAYLSDAAGHWHKCKNCDATDTKADHVYDNDSDATCNTCGHTRAVTPPAPTYSITGAVTENNAAVSGAAVKLVRGKDEIDSATTDSEGNYVFSNVAPGSYNVVATKDGKTMTILVTVTGSDLTEQNLVMPSDKVNSVLDVKETTVTNAAADVTKTVVGGLEAEAQENKEENKTVTVTMTVEAKAEADAPNAPVIKAEAGADKTLEYIEITVEKKVDEEAATPITTTNGLLTIVIPFDFTGKNKNSVTVYRYHGGSVDTLTTAANGAGEKIVLGEDSITLMVKNFSTYAIGYTETTSKPSTPSTRPSRPTTEQPAQPDAPCPKDDTCPIAKFADAKTTKWYHNGVHYCLEEGLMEGTSETTFAPEMSTSRAMIATILWRLSGSPAPKARIADFPDVADGTWYADAVRWCAEQDIVRGYGNGKFGPEDTISREQLAVMLYRCAKAQGDGEIVNGTEILRFADAGDVADWAKEAMTWAVDRGVVCGKNADTLDPQGPATRAEAATMLWRFLTAAEK